jgi:hypothetical protein
VKRRTPHTNSHGSYIVRDEDLDVGEVAAGLGFVERRQSKKFLKNNNIKRNYIYIF